MMLDFLFIAAGLAILIVAGGYLVRGAVSLALRLGIPALIVSLTIVAFGTSAPELLVAVQSALEGAPGIAFGNVVGSNIANVLLVLGLPALIAGIDTTKADMRSYWVMLGVSAGFIALCYLGHFGPLQGGLLLLALAVIILDAIKSSKAEVDSTNAEGIESGDPDMPGAKIAFFLLAGLIGLPIGAHLLIEGAVAVARDMNVSETVIGLTIVAVGTSLPELATSVVAAMKKQSDVAIGNVIGSNIFNILAIMGVASFFGPLAVPQHLINVDVWVMIGVSIVLLPFLLRNSPITRLWGIAFVSAYGFYVTVLIL